MTIDTMRWHEAVNVHYDRDFRRQSLVRLARRYVLGPRVLDMRCITGALALDLAQAGMDVTALDGYDGAVEQTNARAKARGLPPLAQSWDLTGLVARVGRDCFDTVVCLDVLNHALDDRAMAAEIAQVVKPGGRVIIAAPAFPRLLGKRDQSLGHLRRYTRAQLKALLETHGLQVESMRFWNFISLPLYWLIERGLNARISDEFRYGWWSGLGEWPNRGLTWWYLHVENRIRFPLGMTHVVIAQRPAERLH
jgi:2-polyprenyl-3-methyl-5-hydroxy-6-metoxy-1,4-benzoquinol methylase